MEIHKLQQLLSEMSLQEKIGQMVQLTGVYFDKEAVLTGVVGEQLPPEWVIQYAGSVLGVIGKEKICDIQSKYMEQHPHHIPLLFMADVIHGCRTIFPIPLGQACSFHPELVSEAAPIEFTNVRPADKKSGYQKEKEKYRFTVQIATVILSNAPD